MHADQSAALAAAEAVRLMEALGDAWGASPPAVLRSGGLGVRDLKRLGTQLDVDTETAARLVETAYAAGLVGDDGELDPRWAPTPSFDDWCSLDLARRWASLAGAWLTTTRSPVLVGTRDAKDSPRNALGPDLDRAMAPQVRGWLLAALADLRPDVAADLPSLAARLDWSSPRRAGSMRSTLLRAAHTEASWLGLLGAGALATFARPLLDDHRHSEQAAAQALDKALPPPVDHLLLQADLTAVPRAGSPTSWRASSTWRPTPRAEAAGPSTGSARPRCVGRWTSDAPATTSKPGCARCRRPPYRSRWSI